MSDSAMCFSGYFLRPQSVDVNWYSRGEEENIMFYSFEEKIILFKQTSLWAYCLPIFGEDVKIDENFFNFFPDILLIEKGTEESLHLFEEIRAEIFKEKEISKFNERMFYIKTTILLNSESVLNEVEEVGDTAMEE